MKASSLEMVVNMGYKKVRSTASSFTMCDGKHHIIGTGGYGTPGVEPHIKAVAIQYKKGCDCGDKI